MSSEPTSPAREAPRDAPTASPEPVELLGLVPEEAADRLAAALEEAGEPSYRLDQLTHWLYGKGARVFGEITTLPTGLRSALASRFSLTPLEPTYTARSEDGTVKHLWALGDGEQVESVLIPTADRLTLCLSSQAGCALGCRFCATGHFGFQRQLSAGEIVAQYREASLFAREEMGREITNVVYMGMGEPMANLEAVLTSLQVLNRGFGVGARKITVSTVGLVPGIRALARRPEAFGLAVSLHAPRHELRAEIMPVEKRFPLPELMDAIRQYQEAKGRRVSFEYILIHELNDTPELAAELADLLDDLTCFVNLIPFNPIPDVEWEPSAPDRISRFVRELHRQGVSAAVREPRGRDIAAACGQLRLEKGGSTGSDGGG
jgi:23S rRNA (adenine2503-C2)-methyltransferase